MPKYVYTAKKGLSQNLEGAIEAENKEDALNKLIAQGLFPVNISEAQVVEAGQKKTRHIKKIKRRVTSRDVLLFTQKLTTLIRARLELLSSLRIIYEQTDNLRFKEIIQEVYNRIKEGKPFSEALGQFPDIFSHLYINIIKSGEASGRLDSALEQVSEFLYRQEALKTKVSVALAYPVMLIFVGLISIFVLITFVVPKLRPIFEGFGTKLPLITKIILKISLLSNKSWWIVLLIVVFFVFILYFRKGGRALTHLIGKFFAGLPILRRLVKAQELNNFSRSLSLLIRSGVPALKSLEIATLSIQENKLRSELKVVCHDVSSGQGIAKCMAAATSLPNFFIKMVAVGEESGRISEVLDEISRSYTQQIEADISLVTSLLEPVLILVLGAILGTIVLSILLPTFQITQLVH